MKKFVFLSFVFSILSLSIGLYLGKYIDIGFGNNESIISKTGKSGFPLFLSIFLNNFKVSAIIIIGGIFTLGIVSFVYLIFNGMIIHTAVIASIHTRGFYETSLLLIPHGITEIISIILSGSISSFSLIFILFKIFKENNLNTRRIFQLFCRLCIVIILLLLLSSFIETYITLELSRLLK